MAKRQWSREFTPRTERSVNLNISNVPPTLRQKFSAKCKRENKSQRNLLLGWIRNWVAGRRPDEDPIKDDEEPLDPDVDAQELVAHREIPV